MRKGWPIFLGMLLVLLVCGSMLLLSDRARADDGVASPAAAGSLPPPDPLPQGSEGQAEPVAEDARSTCGAESAQQAEDGGLREPSPQSDLLPARAEESPPMGEDGPANPAGVEPDRGEGKAAGREIPEVPEGQSREGEVTVPDPRFLVIHSMSSSIISNEAAHAIMSLINPSFPQYRKDDPSTWAVNFDVRSTAQIGEMPDERLRALLENADIVILHWIGTDHSNLKIMNILNGHPGIAGNRPGKLFIMLEAGADLIKLSRIGGAEIFSGVPDADIGVIFNDLKNANVANLTSWKGRYPQLSDWLDMAIYQARKGIPNIANMYRFALWKYKELVGGVWAQVWKPEWDPRPPQAVPNEMLYRNGRIFLNLEEYFAAYPLDPSKPTAGIVEYTTPMLAGNMDHFETLIGELAARGMNVIPVVGAYSGTTGSGADTRPNNIYSAMVKFFTTAPTARDFEAASQNYRSRIDVMVSFFFFSLGSGYLDQTWRLLEFLDVPVLRAMTTNKRTLGEWLVSEDGLLWSDTYYQIAIPETQGIIEPIMVATTDTTLDEVTGAELVSYGAIPERMGRLADRARNWVRLRYLPNGDKRVALIYYNYPPGKDNIGASYLNVPESIIEIMRTLAREGYALEGSPETEEELLALILERAINVAAWAPGILERIASNPKAILWDEEDYLDWFEGLDPVARKQVIEGPVGYIEELVRTCMRSSGDDAAAKSALVKTIETWAKEMAGLLGAYPEKSREATALLEVMRSALMDVVNGADQEKAWANFNDGKRDFFALGIPGITGWGEPPGDVMTVTRDGKTYILIPGLLFGNLFVGPEPLRGWDADADKLYHSTIVPPHHQYLAWYAWVNEVFGAHAQVHLGRHATYEWLPRKQVALSNFDYSDIMISDTPSIYIYIVDGVGEGLQAKRRGLAVIVDHLTPPMRSTALYGGFLELRGLIEEYDAAASAGNPTMMKEYAQAIRSKAKGLNLHNDLDVDLDALEDEKLVEAVGDYLLELMRTIMPYGLHSFALRWSDEEVALLATSMVSVDGGAANPSLPRLLAEDKGWNFDSLTFSQAEDLHDLAFDWVFRIIRGEATPQGLTTNARLRNKLIEAETYARRITSSFAAEMDALTEALVGRFITPSTGKDPLRNPAALPTGKNFYAVSEQLLPTTVAWNLGKRLADMALAQLSELPEKVAAVVWCVETARDDGTMVSFVLRMLGIEPEQTSSWLRGGSVGRMTATPLSTLLSDLNAARAALGLPALDSRPRIDVVITTSGLFRDLFPRTLVNMDRAIRVALGSSYNDITARYPDLKPILDYALEPLAEAKYVDFRGSDPIERNHVAKHWLQLVLGFVGRGTPGNVAGELAITRIFAPPVGDYGAGVSNVVEQPWTWDSREQVAGVYLGRMGHAYSERAWGVPSRDLFESLLAGIGHAYHGRSTFLYGVLDNDDCFDYFGGLSMAIETVTGTGPVLNVLHYANPTNARVDTLTFFLSRELRSRYFNPKWIRGMMLEGYSGARTIANKFVNHLWGWEVTNPNVVGDWMWEEVVDVYINDKYGLGTLSWLSTGNMAYSLTEITGTLLTAIHKGFWTPEEAAIRQLADTWARSIIEHGASCSGVSCGNYAMFHWVLPYLDPSLLKDLSDRLEAATKKPLIAPPDQPPSEDGDTNPPEEDRGGTPPAEDDTQPDQGAEDPEQGTQDPEEGGAESPPAEGPQDHQPGETWATPPAANFAPSFSRLAARTKASVTPVPATEGRHPVEAEAAPRDEGGKAYEVFEEQDAKSQGLMVLMLVLGIFFMTVMGLLGYLLAGRK